MTELSVSLPPPPQMELNDGIAMMVGNNDRMQGIISQLEETCRAIEVSVQWLAPVASACSVRSLTRTDIETDATCPSHRHPLRLSFCVT